MDININELRTVPHLSASAVSDYVGCGLHYRFRRIDKVEPEFTSANLKLGTLIHKVLADYYMEKKVGGKLSQQDLHSVFEQYCRRELEENDEVEFEDEADYEKAFRYQYLLEETDRFRGYCLGTFVFYLGDTTQESLTWWNLTVGPFKRESYYVIKKHYTGQEEKNKPPFCTGLEIDKAVVSPKEEICAMIKARDRENDELTYDILIGTSKENILLYIVNEIVPIEVIQMKRLTLILMSDGISRCLRIQHSVIWIMKGYL